MPNQHTRNYVTIEQRFWSHVKKTKTCWLWTAAVSPFGHGRFYLGSRQHSYAHRYSYELHYGPIPKGLFVCHKCDIPNCVRPDHLFLGTLKDNMQDAKKKKRLCTGSEWQKAHDGRHQCGEQHHMNRRPDLRSIGDTNGNAKLTENDVRCIRSLYSSGRYTYPKLAELFGVTHTMIALIVLRKYWKHI